MSLTPPSADEIRARRNVLGLSQAAFAERLGVSKRAVEEWEAGRNAAPPMLRLALNSLAPSPNGVAQSSMDDDLQAVTDALSAVRLIVKHYASSAPGCEMVEDVVQILAVGGHNMGQFGGIRLNVADAISKAYLNKALIPLDPDEAARLQVINALLID